MIARLLLILVCVAHLTACGGVSVTLPPLPPGPACEGERPSEVATELLQNNLHGPPPPKYERLGVVFVGRLLSDPRGYTGDLRCWIGRGDQVAMAIWHEKMLPSGAQPLTLADARARRAEIDDFVASLKQRQSTCEDYRPRGSKARRVFKWVADCDGIVDFERLVAIYAMTEAARTGAAWPPEVVAYRRAFPNDDEFEIRMRVIRTFVESEQ